MQYTICIKNRIFSIRGKSHGSVKRMRHSVEYALTSRLINTVESKMTQWLLIFLHSNLQNVICTDITNDRYYAKFDIDATGSFHCANIQTVYVHWDESGNNGSRICCVCNVCNDSSDNVSCTCNVQFYASVTQSNKNRKMTATTSEATSLRNQSL